MIQTITSMMCQKETIQKKSDLIPSFDVLGLFLKAGYIYMRQLDKSNKIN